MQCQRKTSLTIKTKQTMKTKELNQKVVNAIEFVCKNGNMAVYSFILKNYEKGYKPAKDFVKQIVEKIESGELKSNIDLINHISNKEISEVVPYTYSKHRK